MVLTFINKFLKKKSYADFFKYLIIGAIVTIMNIFFTWFLIDIINIDTIISTTVVLILLHLVKFYSYRITKLFSKKQMQHIQFVVYTLVTVFCSVLNIFFNWLLIDFWHLPTVQSLTVVAIGLFLLRFILFKITNLIDKNPT